MLALNQLRLVFLAVAAILAGAMAFRLFHGDAFWRLSPALTDKGAPTADALSAARARILARLDSVPDYKLFIDKFERAYPRDWASFLDDAARRVAAGGSLDSADAYVENAIRTIRRNRGVMAARSGPEALGRIFDAQERLLTALSVTDPRLCVDFLFGQTSRAFTAFSATHRQTVIDLADATLDAIKDGTTTRTTRDTPTDADFNMLESSLTDRGLNAAEISALLDGRMPDPPIGDARLCDAGKLYLDAMKGLPDDARLRIYALAVELMARG